MVGMCAFLFKPLKIDQMKTTQINVLWIAKLSNGKTIESRRQSIERVCKNIRVHIDKIVPSGSEEGRVMFIKAQMKGACV